MIGGFRSLDNLQEIDAAEKQVKPSTINNNLIITRTFFADCKQKGLFPIQIIPEIHLQTPKHIRQQIIPHPRTIEKDIWEALLCAGMELIEADLDYQQIPTSQCYPLEMVRAVAITWLFGGLRPGQIPWLEVDCIEWWLNGVSLKIVDETPPLEAICKIKVPPHKGASTFWKEVSRYIGLAVQAWEQIRPEAPSMYNPRANASQLLLFVHNTHMIGVNYLNAVLIPLLCKKAGIETHDAKGNITAHRARSNALTELAYNRERPRTLDELRTWAGHRSISPIMSYIRLREPEQQPAYNGTRQLSAEMSNTAARAVDIPLSPVQIIALRKCMQCPLFRLKHSGRPLVMMTQAKLLEIRASASLSEGELTTLSTVISTLDSMSARFTQELGGVSDG
jgi:integrase